MLLLGASGAGKSTLAFGCEALGVPRDEIWSRVTSALDVVGLHVSLDASTAQLSGGQKQRLALAGILAMRPGIVMLDEPTANLDPAGVAEVRDGAERMLDATGATVIVIEHRVPVCRNLVSRVIVLGTGGSVLADGPLDAVLGTHAAALAEAGVWVPGFLPDRPIRPEHNGATILEARAVAIGREATIQSGLDFAVTAGRCLAITGPNGAGKTTLGLTLGGLLAPRSGAVVATSLPCDTDGVRRRRSWRRGGASRTTNPAHPYDWTSRQLVSRIGSVFQDPEHQFVASTARRELEVGLAAIGLDPAERPARINSLLEQLRLHGLADANPFTLSGGEKCRLSVATALITGLAVVILDEPTFGQDLRTWGELVGILAGLLGGGTAVVAVTHDFHLVDALADDELRMVSAHESS